MRKEPAILAAMVLCAASPVAANEVSFQLRATVPVICHVTEMRAVDLQAGLVEIETICNADGFRLVLGGDLGERPINSATSTSAAVAVHGNQLAVRPDRPGAFRFQLDYGTDLSSVLSVSADLTAL